MIKGISRAVKEGLHVGRFSRDKPETSIRYLPVIEKILKAIDFLIIPQVSELLLEADYSEIYRVKSLKRRKMFVLKFVNIKLVLQF